MVLTLEDFRLGRPTPRPSGKAPWLPALLASTPRLWLRWNSSHAQATQRLRFFSLFFGKKHETESNSSRKCYKKTVKTRLQSTRLKPFWSMAVVAIAFCDWSVVFASLSAGFLHGPQRMDPVQLIRGPRPKLVQWPPRQLGYQPSTHAVFPRNRSGHKRIPSALKALDLADPAAVVLGGRR